jgi:DNA-binding response OmpR family regulator
MWQTTTTSPSYVTATDGHGQPKRATVAIIEDTRAILDLLTEFLSDEGYAVQAMSDPQRGLSFIQDNPPDVLLLDLMMPQLPGWEIFDRLRTNPTTAHLPIILITAVPRTGLREYRTHGTDHTTLLLKPLDLDELTANIERLLTTTPERRHGGYLSQ